MRFIIIGIILSITVFDTSSQIVHDAGTPLGFGSDTKSLSWFDPGFNQSEIENLRNPENISKGLLQFALSYDTELNPDNSGILTEHNNGLSTWHMLISSEDAASLGIIFSRFDLNEGEKVFIYDPGMKMVLGPFTSKNNKSSRVLPVVPLEGSHLIIEYQFYKENRGELQIGQITHDALGIFGKLNQKDVDFGMSGPCNVDVNCSEGDDWGNEKRAVVKLLINNTYLGTGTMINNTTHQNIPYVLTAAHVVSTSFEAERTITIFNYESPWCDGPDGSVSKSVSGAYLMSENDDIDVTLLKLTEFPPILYKPYMAGWDVSGNIPANQVCIHHPAGDVKKISYDYDPPIIGTFEGNYTAGFWKILQWDIGTTEGGSSGSPLFDPDHRIVGTLTGGEARCGNSVNDYFARLDISYDITGSSLSSLEPWLDFVGVGSLIVNGRDPYANNFSQSDTLFNGVDSEFYLTDYDGGESGMTTGFNSDSLIAYAEKFIVPSPVEITDVFMYVGSSNYVLAQDYVEISILNDIGGPGSVIASEVIRIKETKDTFLLRLDFSEPVNVDGTFYVAYRNRYINEADADPRQFAVFHGSTAAPGSEFAWFQDDTGWHQFTSHPYDPGENTLYIKVVTVKKSIIVSIGPEIFEQEEISLYPNPFTDYIVLESEKLEDEIESVTIMDLSGKLLRNHSNISSNHFTVDGLRALNSGVYLLSVKIAGHYLVYKVVKK